ncbi:MAG: hypothetical protein Q7S73_02620 [bacterium]|nr:hypothetical protein [bacterium]
MDKFENGIPKIEHLTPHSEELNKLEEKAVQYLTQRTLYKEDSIKGLEKAMQLEDVDNILYFRNEIKKSEEEIESGKGLLKAIDERRKGYNVAQQLSKEASKDFKDKKD